MVFLFQKVHLEVLYMSLGSKFSVKVCVPVYVLCLWSGVSVCDVSMSGASVCSLVYVRKWCVCGFVCGVSVVWCVSMCGVVSLFCLGVVFVDVWCVCSLSGVSVVWFFHVWCIRVLCVYVWVWCGVPMFGMVSGLSVRGVSVVCCVREWCIGV